jgi:hypothetical protein
MNRPFLRLMLFTILFGPLAAARAQQNIVLPAGTLLNCTLDEPNLSPATAEIDDPVLCHLDAIQAGRVLPRGSYLVGHIANEQQPGHFVGKGSMVIIFDRIGLSNSDLPLPAKVIAVHGYRVNREETIIGHGHAKRDAVEWMVPVLWPWKVLMLPAKGPEPALKGEVRVTLRVMEDLVPQQAGTPQMPSSAALQYQQQVGSYKQTPSFTLLALRSGKVYEVSGYWRSGTIFLRYTLPGSNITNMVDLRDLDWTTTTQLNQTRGVAFRLP